MGTVTPHAPEARETSPPSRIRAAVSRRLGTRHWLVEVAVMVAIYLVYGRVRGAVEGAQPAALEHAHQVIHAERALALFVERSVQQWFLSWEGVVRAWNVYYGSIHFVVPLAALVVLWHWRRWRYWYVRDVFIALMVLGIIGFVVYPLMPPRFVPDLHILDTAARLGPWSEDPKDAANLYAAMPSLHIGWSSWCVFALWPVLRRWWSRALLVSYPFFTLTAIVVTGNHYWLDGVGGLAALATAVVLVRLLWRVRAAWRMERTPPAWATRPLRPAPRPAPMRARRAQPEPH